MSKYARTAIYAASLARSGLSPQLSWEKAAAKVFPSQLASRNKGCPRCAFLGLAEEGLIKGIQSGKYTNSQSNKAYALEGLKRLRAKPELVTSPESLWRQVISSANKQHNDQMSVLIGLFQSGDIE